ncbi:MAG: amidohydrolase family protein [Candidatus Cloacimonetes bacterium]|nr:amidohydrolase family protein [Candidatus Cloacimonadota bacterium]
MKRIKTNVLNPIDSQHTQLIPNCIIGYEDDKIVSVTNHNPNVQEEVQDFSDCVCLPGLIDLHVHLSQYDIRGMYRPALLPWLSEVVFPEEAKSRQASFAASIGEHFFDALLKTGTTTAVVYTAPFFQACDLAFEIAREKGIRALIGMTLMDRNSPRDLLQSTSYALEGSIELYEKWHKRHPLLDYIFTPRFAPTCSAELMKALGEFTARHGSYLQTHLSENIAELKWVKQLFGMNSYTEVYEHYGILSSKTILAHAIHLSVAELDILHRYDTKIAHCPDSNFYLKSGEFNFPQIKEHGLKFGLGSDVGAGTCLNMLYHAKISNYRQSSYPILPEETFYSITLGSAEVLGWQSTIGSIEAGKQADFVFLKPLIPEITFNETLLSRIIFCPEDFRVTATFVAGKTVFSK